MHHQQGVVRWYHTENADDAYKTKQKFIASANFLKLSDTEVFIWALISHNGERLCLSDYVDLSNELVSEGVEWIFYTRGNDLKIQHTGSPTVVDFKQLMARA